MTGPKGFSHMMKRLTSTKLMWCLALVMACVTFPHAVTAEEASPGKDEQLGSALPEIIIAIDGSRSTGSQKARLNFLSRVLLPVYGDIIAVQFDHDIATLDAPADMTFGSITSDYRALLHYTPAPEIVIGDGLIDVVHGKMGRDYQTLLPPGATRDAINAKVTEMAGELYRTQHEKSERDLLVLMPGPLEDGSLWTTPKGIEGHPALIDLSTEPVMRHITDYQQEKGRKPRLKILGGKSTVIEPRAPMPIRLGEGVESLEILIHAVGNTGDFSAVLGGIPTGTARNGLSVEEKFSNEAGALLVVTGAAEGVDTTLTVNGPSEKYEVMVLYATDLQHRLQARHPDGLDQFYVGDSLSISHELVRAGNTPVDEVFLAEVVSAGELRVTGSGTLPVIVDKETLRLPDSIGEAVLHFDLKDPYNQMITTQSLPLTWTIADTLVLKGGWKVIDVYDGDPVELEFRQSGGKRPLTTATVSAVGEKGQSKDIPLKLNDGVWQSTVVFSAEERGKWRLSGVSASATAALIFAPDESAGTLEVKWNWWPLLLTLLGLLLLLLVALLIYILTLPRWKGELLHMANGPRLLSEVPGTKPRCTSIWDGSLRDSILIRKTRKGVIIEEIKDGIHVYVNAAPVAPGAIIVPGNDVEVVRRGKSLHGRFFGNKEEMKSWSAQRGQIHPHQSLGQEIFVIDLEGKLDDRDEREENG